MAKRNSKTGYIGMAAFVAVIIFAVLSTTVFFKVKTVTVKGSSIYTAEEICAASGVKSGNNLIRTNTSKIAQRLEEDLTYVETAKVRRSFPSGVEITITPCREMISAEYEDGFCLLSESGKVLKTAETPFPDTIVVYGARAGYAEDEENSSETSGDPSVTSAISEAAEKDEEEEINPLPSVGARFACDKDNRTEIFYELIEVAQGAFSGKANDFDMTDHHNISCIYDNRIKIEFGAATELEYKIKFASKILKDKIGKKTEGTLHMLAKGARFIDKAGIEQNEINYEKNIDAQTSQTTEEALPDESQNTDTSAVVHFE